MLGAGGSKSPYLVEGAVPGEMLDIPAWARAWADYSASSGHLINHAAAPGVEYRDCGHPRFGHVLCVLCSPSGSVNNLVPQYGVEVDEEGIRFALRTALQLGQMVSGKTKQQFVTEIRPYMKMVVEPSKQVNLADFIKI